MSKLNPRALEITRREETGPDAAAIRAKNEAMVARIRPYSWQPGQSGNPAGRPKDVAREIARKVFINNDEAIYRGMAEKAAKGDAYAFKELAERAFGKLRESVAISHQDDTSDADLGARIAALERDLGLARAIDEAGRAGIAKAGTDAASEPKKTDDVLP